MNEKYFFISFDYIICLENYSCYIILKKKFNLVFKKKIINIIFYKLKNFREN